MQVINSVKSKAELHVNHSIHNCDYSKYELVNFV